MNTAAAAPIPFVDLKAQYQVIRGEIDRAIAETVEQTAFIMGRRVEELENDFARFCGARYAIGCSSGTSALHLALTSAGIGAGDEVITVSHTFIATAEAVIHTGATPVLVDIDPETYCIDVEQIEAAITPRTKAILPVHIYGQLADMDPIMDLAQRHGLMVIEDAAQAHGAEHENRRAGSMGTLGCFSFYPGKNLGAYGDAGMVITSDEEQAERIRLLVNHGRETKYTHKLIGFNYRLDGIQAAVLGIKLKHLEGWNESRRRLAHRYNDLLSDVDVVTPVEKRGHVYHLYVIQYEDRDGLGEALKADGIATGIHYPVPLHQQPCLDHLPGAKEGRFPVTEALTQRIISLPMFPEMTEAQQNRVVESIRRYVNR
jgi:dTDP-4-amino-4,6-dideoxygalactose transaminase